ncbi:hypothetical protein [Thermosulfurimonas sp. F29]|uniref:hypothetical protein n=1 Tax=Thermosulfurimonas sp. F29 TaxID=2867247 RepID=UPI001C83BA4A|nr:hypothetical protein [Thermosulfurimonas sp. F29]MBX6424158.1 hypothetical protein [Thermosulfurimonas sp. F29]
MVKGKHKGLLGLFQAVNLTPHPITVLREDGTQIELPSLGGLRLKEETETVPWSESLAVPVVDKRFTELEVQVKGAEELETLQRILTDPTRHVALIVSLPVIQVLSSLDNQKLAEVLREALGKAIGREVLAGLLPLAPDTGPASAVRDRDGRIIGVRRFVRSVKYAMAPVSTSSPVRRRKVDFSP